MHSECFGRWSNFLLGHVTSIAQLWCYADGSPESCSICWVVYEGTNINEVQNSNTEIGLEQYVWYGSFCPPLFAPLCIVYNGFLFDHIGALLIINVYYRKGLTDDLNSFDYLLTILISCAFPVLINCVKETIDFQVHHWIAVCVK